VKLDSVIPNVVEVAGRRILRAMVGGQREAKVLASLGSPRLKASSQAVQGGVAGACDGASSAGLMVCTARKLVHLPAAQTAGITHRPWRPSHSLALNHALPTSFFHSLGLPALVACREFSPDRCVRTRTHSGVTWKAVRACLCRSGVCYGCMKRMRA
jgi:hypothetical protein